MMIQYLLPVNVNRHLDILKSTITQPYECHYSLVPIDVSIWWCQHRPGVGRTRRTVQFATHDTIHIQIETNKYQKPCWCQCVQFTCTHFCQDSPEPGHSPGPTCNIHTDQYHWFIAWQIHPRKITFSASHWCQPSPIYDISIDVRFETWVKLI